MKKFLTTKNIKKILTPTEILSGNFGFEKEGLRINSEGKLSLTPHPKIFGNKLTNPYITTDFSESQVEIVTPTFNSVKKAYQCLSFLVDIVNKSIQQDQYIWNQSLPCILPEDNNIPIAKYEGKKGEEALIYRKQLAQKYGTKKQMISGIHYNFSISEDTIRKLYNKFTSEISYKNFKNQIYLKIVRNYLRYKWLIIYLTGATPAAHKTFTDECLELMKNNDKNNDYYSEEGASFRNSHIGYKNLVSLYPSYNSVKEFTEDVNNYIREGLLSEAKELYSQIRLKPKDPLTYLNSLIEDGINYVELRTIDINPFDKCGISLLDMEFIHIFLIYLLLNEESDYVDWQKEALYNEEIIAEKCFVNDITLVKNGEEIKFKTWATDIINEIKDMNKILNLEKEYVINKIEERIINPNKTYSKQLIDIIKNKGFIDSQIMISKNNKETSEELIDFETIRNNEELYEIYTKSLPLLNI